MMVSESHVRRWLRWHRLQQCIDVNEQSLKEDPTNFLLYDKNEALKRQRDRWKVPKGWKSWEEIGKYANKTA